MRRFSTRTSLAFGLGTVAGLGSVFLAVTGRRGKGSAPLPPAGRETVSPVQTA